MKPSITKILSALGFNGINDLVTIISPDTFDKLDSKLVIEAMLEHNINSTILGDSDINDLSSDSKLEVINRILEMRYGMIIDSLKDMDQITDLTNLTAYQINRSGYKLELMPAGF